MTCWRGQSYAGFPRDKHIDDFDFTANSSVSPAVIHQLATCAWTKTFTDPRLCAAMVDRLTFAAGQIIETGTTSYRLAHARRVRDKAS